MELFQQLAWRGLVKDVTDEPALIERLKKPIVLYCGFDPTADSLHIGHLQQLLLLKRYVLEGHKVIALIGGATGMIGDPRPTSERALTSLETIEKNVIGIKKQIEHVLGHSDSVLVVNNYDWLSKLNVLAFLRDFGKHFNVNTMINKDIVASRLETGISYTEFSYTLLQAADWLHLYQTYQCEMQIGGSDQWGNLTSGTELIRKMSDTPVKVFGVTSPLITKSDGSKFGKSEGKNIWLDPLKTNAYQFYQYWINVSDDDVIDFMKRLSFKSVSEIQLFESKVASQPHLREAQIALAKELTELVFDRDSMEMAIRISDVLFKMDFESLSHTEFEIAFEDAPTFYMEGSMNIIEAMTMTELVKSNRQARELITHGSVSVNNVKVETFDFDIKKDDAYFNQYAIIKKGKKSFVVLKF